MRLRSLYILSKNVRPKMRGDLPGVTPFIFNHTATVSVRGVERLFQGNCAGVEGSPVHNIRIFDIDIEKGGHWAANSDVADHDHRVADPDHGRNGLLIFSPCAENLPEELD